MEYPSTPPLLVRFMASWIRCGGTEANAPYPKPQDLRWDGVKQKINTAFVFLHVLSTRERLGGAGKEK